MGKGSSLTPNREIPGVLIHAWSRLTNARVLDKVDFGSGRLMFKDMVVNAISFNHVSLSFQFRGRLTGYKSMSLSGKSKCCECQNGHEVLKTEQH
jgi:hypothetical protein